MLQLKNISKQYTTGALIQRALDDVSLSFRDSEFVSILGPSGSGKSTLLNLIGGLDRCDSGELVINRVSTQTYRDRDWDSYRNHAVGFVFQSYHLIPHQSVLANVELALTIAGVSRKERHDRAKAALERVGLGDQLHKRPSQMSGGQMQRVAIARALVNDPAILLADEPTGALDTETSIQIMDLLREVAKDRLVVMVTHNPELAQAYSTRIVRLRDGKVIDDSDPFDPEEAQNLPEPESWNLGRAKMSFLTALSLSFHNLRTKKGRTLLTSFAGSIGITGIALILALSSGVNDYIGGLQRDTMAAYPITIQAETVDMTQMMGMGPMIGGRSGKSSAGDRDGVYADVADIQTARAGVVENDLTAFKRYLDDPGSDIAPYLGENGVVYGYDVKFDVYSYDGDGALVSSADDPEELTGSSGGGFGDMFGGMNPMSGMMGSGTPSGAENFSQLMAGAGGEAVSPVVTESYEVLYGGWPRRYDQVVLVLDGDNALPAGVLYQLGLLSAREYKDLAGTVSDGGEAAVRVWSYADVCAHTFYLVPASGRYTDNGDGVFSRIGDDALERERLLDGALALTVSGVVKPLADADSASISTAVGYTAALTDYVIGQTDSSAVVLAQEADREVNVLTGMRFEAPDDGEKIEEAAAYVSGLGVSDKASLYTMILYYSGTGGENGGSEDVPDGPDPTSPEDADYTGQEVPPEGAGQMGGMMHMDETDMAQAMDRWLEETPDNGILLSIYEEYVGGASYEGNLRAFGKVSYDAPSSISIYTDSFEGKNDVADCISRYNEGAGEDGQIAYTDYVALMTSSITSMVDVISCVLIAFVAVSLVVSCIMIGIITHISVLERTREIGILRALGASKRNVSQVFNAETVIIGLCSGMLGVGTTVLLTVPISGLLQSLLGAGLLTIALPVAYAGVLVILSVVITVMGGLLPARSAAKKDPVVALRTE